MIKCVSCLSGRAWECIHNGQCETASTHYIHSSSGGDDSSDAPLEQGREVFDQVIHEGVSRSTEVEVIRGPVREVNTYKDDSAIRDQQSTGRKRAAVMYPLDKDADCEWARQANVGGGNHPIVGCIDGKQEARHHGPDKNTLNNEAGNVHRICHNCHNRWHSKNDDGYVWAAVYPQHQPRQATFDEIIKFQAEWVGVKLKKVTD